MNNHSFFVRINCSKKYIRDCLIGLNPKVFLCVCFETVIDSIKPFFVALLPKYIIEELIVYTSIKKLLILIALFLFSVFILDLIKSKVEKYIDIENDKIIHNMNVRVGEKHKTLSYEQLEKQEIINLSQMARRCVENAHGIKNIFDLTKMMISSLITIGGFSYIVFKTAPLLLSIIPIYMVFNLFIVKKINKLNREYFIKTVPQDNQYSHYFGNMLDFKYGKDVRMFKMQDLFSGKADLLSENLKIYYDEKSAKTTKLNLAQVVLKYAQLFFLYFFVIYKTIEREITISNFVMFINITTSLINAIENVTVSFFKLSEYLTGMNDYFEFMSLTSLVDEQQNIKSKTKIKNIQTIRFEHVYFKYPDTDKFILNDISFCINMGEKIAIVGLNGAGKSSLIKLLLRFYKPTKGEIYLNNVNIEEIDLSNYYSLVSVAFQDFQLFATTVKENIYTDCNIEKDKTFTIIENLKLKSFIEKYPQGLNAELYTIFTDSGVTPSQGEAQKIAIARALCKNSECFILDEPTASLDPIAELDLYHSFEQILRDKMVILVSHRLLSCKFCDYIFVLHNGTIFECGTHKDLINKDGLYAKLFKKQLEHLGK